MCFDETNARGRIREFIIENMDAFYSECELNDSDNIFEKGFVSSIFAIRLLSFIEKGFDIEVSDDMLRLENFNSVENIIGMISKIQADDVQVRHTEL